MNIGEPKMLTPEKMAEIEKQKTLSDSELLKGGAEYQIDEKGNKRLDATEKQKENTQKEMEKDLNVDSSDKSRVNEIINTVEHLTKSINRDKIDQIQSKFENIKFTQGSYSQFEELSSDIDFWARFNKLLRMINNLEVEK